MKYNQITLPLVLLISMGAQSLIGHGEIFKFTVDKTETGNCADAKRIGNIFAPTYEDLVEIFGSEEVVVSVPVGTDKKVDLTKKDLAKLVLIGRDLVHKTQHNLHHHKNRLDRAIIVAAKNLANEMIKDQVIGFVIAKGASKIPVPSAVKNSKFLAAAGYVASKAAGFALNVGYEAGMNYVFPQR